MFENRSKTRLFVPALGGLYDGLGAYAYPVVRFVVGAFLVPHGYTKLFGGLPGTAEAFGKMGFEPAAPLALLVALVEFAGGIMIALGFLTRPAAIAAAVLLGVATSVHWGAGFFWNKGGYEYALMWTVLCLVVAVRGGGPLSVDRAVGREF